jgi:hypothetical protein
MRPKPSRSLSSTSSTYEFGLIRRLPHSLTKQACVALLVGALQLSMLGTFVAVMDWPNAIDDRFPKSKDTLDSPTLTET